jgi:uncharacterized protein (DUF58 family)
MATATTLSPATVAAAGVPDHRWPVGVGPRGFLLLAAGLLCVLPAWIDWRTLILLPVWDLLLLIAWIADLRRLPRPSEIHLTRAWSGPLGLDTPTQVTLSLRHSGAVPIQAHLTDYVASDLHADLIERELDVPPRAEASVSYAVQPRERGDMPMGPVLIR